MHPAQILPNPDEESARRFLTALSWPPGLQEQLIFGTLRMPLRFVLVDNSGSMTTADGQHLMVQGTHRRFMPCSRWSELTDALRFHASLAEAARAPTEFRLLNNAPPILLGVGEQDHKRFNLLMSYFDQYPSGATPLCHHIREVVRQIQALTPQLRANGQRIGLIIATDGEASDGDIADAMAPLRYLPVWVVIRLCTGEIRVCEYWNNLDKQLELDMDVIDDIESEANDIYKVNDWFTYGEPLHRLREFGITMKDMDLIDENTLATDQMRNLVVALTTGGAPSSVPHPSTDWKGFLQQVRAIGEAVPKTWCPRDKAVQPWVRVPQLVKRYSSNNAGCGVM